MKKVLLKMVALLLLVVPVVGVLTACLKDKFEGKYIVSQVVLTIGENQEPVTKAEYDELSSKENLTMEEEMKLMLCSAIFSIEIEFKEDKTAIFKEGGMGESVSILGTWTREGDIVTFSIEDEPETQNFTVNKNNTLTLVIEEATITFTKA